MKITKEQIPEWEELIRILSLYSIYGVSLHKIKGMSKTLSFFKKKITPYESRFYLLQDDYISKSHRTVPTVSDGARLFSISCLEHLTAPCGRRLAFMPAFNTAYIL